MPCFRHWMADDRFKSCSLIVASELGLYTGFGTEIICALPVLPRYSLSLTLTNGKSYDLRIGDGFVELPEGRYGVKDAAQKQIAKVNDALDADARQEKETLQKQLVSEPKPLVYTVGTLDDGGTLSGIADVLRRRQQMENNL